MNETISTTSPATSQAAAGDKAPGTESAGEGRSIRWGTIFVWAGVVALLALLGWGLLNVSEGRPDAGVEAPTFDVQFFDGYGWQGSPQASLDDFRGNVVVLNFWASWCPPCIAEMPDFESVHQAVGGQVAFVGVNTQDRREDAADMVEQTGVTYDLLRDPEGRLFEKFGVFGMPTTFFINAAGEIVERHTGALTLETIAGRVEEHLGVSVDVAA